MLYHSYATLVFNHVFLNNQMIKLEQALGNVLVNVVNPKNYKILSLEESENAEDPEHVAPDEKENFPGSHPLSLEALVKRAHDGLGHPGRSIFEDSEEQQGQ